MRMFMHYIIVLSSIALGAVGQFFLKMAANTASSRSVEEVGGYYMQLFKTPYTYAGAFLYGLSFFIWMFLLRKFNLSFLRPLVGFGYIITAFLAWFLLKEKITMMHWAGIILIVTGVFLIGMQKT